ncbi:hypothetical protein EST38_g6070 [Candolleomyces aberdarensis]|uniref:Uncharacterized protein n=1 Tax=Candolleomyces aberdarensis TaxID=2316362 RepID=A0A4Q2DKV1_9AGAR|nr:hypothetical protein EST38_g6070 [Candolleomyces aberdarensis]
MLEFSELSNQNMLGEMELACALKDHKTLYQLIRRRHLQCDDTISKGSWKGGDWSNSIRIPQFLDRMLISRKISAPHVHWWTLFDITFIVTPSGNWSMRLEREIVHPRKALKSPNRFEVNVHKIRLYENEKHEKWMTDSKKLSGEIRQLRSNDGLNIDFLREWDDFFDKRRTLAITLTLSDWKY